MQPIKGIVETIPSTKMEEFPKIVTNEETGETQIEQEVLQVPTENTYKYYFTSDHPDYNGINYDPKKGSRLFDSEEQAEKAGFIKAV